MFERVGRGLLVGANGLLERRPDELLEVHRAPLRASAAVAAKLGVEGGEREDGEGRLLWHRAVGEDGGGSGTPEEARRVRTPAWLGLPT